MTAIMCSGPGPHAPADGVLGESDSLMPVAGMLCPPCAVLAAQQADPSSSQQPVTADPDDIASALTAATKATTVAQLRSALTAALRAISPEVP